MSREDKNKRLKDEIAGRLVWEWKGSLVCRY